MSWEALATRVAVQIGTTMIPKVGAKLTKWIKSRGNPKQSLEMRMDGAEAIIEELGQGIVRLGEALQSTQHALEASEKSRLALAWKFKICSAAQL